MGEIVQGAVNNYVMLPTDVVGIRFHTIARVFDQCVQNHTSAGGGEPNVWEASRKRTCCI